jgi:hypothetical protein
LFGGINSSDHQVFMDNLFQKLVKNGFGCARLNSKDGSLKNVMRSMIEQFMGLKRELEDQVHLSLEQVLLQPREVTKELYYDMQTLVNWYTKVVANNGPFQLVLFIHDFEGFDVNVMVDLMSILWYFICAKYSENMGDVPIVLLVNVATTGLGFQTCLPISLLSQLDTRGFQLSTSSELINALVTKVCNSITRAKRELL